MDAVAQKDVTNPDVMETRYISGPRLEVDARITNDRRPNCAVPRHANMARRIFYRCARYPGIPVLISKMDAQCAFKLLPVSAKWLVHMGCHFAKVVCMYLTLFCGWRPDPSNWGIISTPLMQYISAHVPSDDPVDALNLSYLARMLMTDLSLNLCLVFALGRQSTIGDMVSLDVWGMRWVIYKNAVLRATMKLRLFYGGSPFPLKTIHPLPPGENRPR